MSLKAPGRILGVFEVTVLVVSLAGWAALGFPEWKQAVVLGLLCIIGIGAFQWFLSRRT